MPSGVSVSSCLGKVLHSLNLRGVQDTGRRQGRQHCLFGVPMDSPTAVVQVSLLYAPSLNKELIVFSIYRVFAMCQLLSALCILQHVYPCKNHVKWVLLASYFRKAETEDQEGNMIGY